MSRDAHPPQLSVVAPLDEHRGAAIAAVRSWLAQDPDALSRCELIVVADGTEPELEREVRSMLRQQDRLLRAEVGNLFSNYNAGAEAASAPMLLFTESHVVAKADCLLAVLREIERSDPPTAMLASGGLYAGRFPETIDRLFEDELPRRLAQGWDTLVVRGTLVKKSLWRSLGGFQSQYGHYTSLLFGAAMWQAGVLTRMIEEARVLHGNEGSFAELRKQLLEFGRMEVRFRADNPHSPLLDRLPVCRNWEQRSKYSRRGADGAIRSGFAATVRAIGRGRLAEALRHAGQTLAATPNWLFGPDWSVAKARVHYHWALVRLRLFAWSPTLYRKAFRDAWGGLIRYGRLLEVADQLRQSAASRTSAPEAESLGVQAEPAKPTRSAA
jgi:glycosyltransferase involved in cell wall biosynthesis